MTEALIKQLGAECGFDLVGIAPAETLPEAAHYLDWARSGMAGEMAYLTDHRAELRLSPKALLPDARSVICVAKLYNGPEPSSTEFSDAERAWISRYAWGEDYHDVLRRDLRRFAARIEESGGPTFQHKICIDTAPFLDVAYARHAGLGWIGKNTCLINQSKGSWFFLGALLTSLELQPDAPPPSRCGTCTRCIDACPTEAIVPAEDAPLGYTVDARRCVSYLTIELRGSIPKEHRAAIGRHVFGCDICQDVCPWNRAAPVERDPAFAPRVFAPPLARMARLTEQEFRDLFRGTPVTRAKYHGFLRNVAVAMGNSRVSRFREPLEALAHFTHPVVREHALWALENIK